MSHYLDDIAVGMFTKAIADGRAGELLECLFDGGTATIDAHTGALVLATDNQLDGIQ